MSDQSYDDKYLERVLDEARTIAIVGVSSNPVRPSYFVANYMKLRNYTIIPVNPGMAGKQYFGNVAVPDLANIPEAVGDVQMVDIFRRSDAVLPIVEQAIEHLLHRGLKSIWMQIGVVNQEAAALARANGLDVVMDRCPKMEYQRLCGELSRGGIKSGIVSSRMPRLTPRG